GRAGSYHLRLGSRDAARLCARHTRALGAGRGRPALSRRERADAGHLAPQPFGQVPWLPDRDLSIFESGAIPPHLGERSAALLPADPRARSEAVQWLFAALSSVEMASLPWALFQFFRFADDTPGAKFLAEFLDLRLQRMEPVLAGRDWLAGTFSVADIVMADALRVVDRFDALAGYPACRDYVARATARPSFVKAHADQIGRAHV